MSFQQMVTDVRALGDNGAYIGRLCPPHLGHLYLADLLLEAFPNTHMIGVGSCNEKVSFKHLFNYGDKRDVLRLLYPNATILPIPDFGNDALWFAAIDDQISAMGRNPKETVFIGGCEEEVEFYYKAGRKVFIVNRFGGLTTKVSGTEVRDALIEGRPLDGMLHPSTIPLVKERFVLRWEELRSK